MFNLCGQIAGSTLVEWKGRLVSDCNLDYVMRDAPVWSQILMGICITLIPLTIIFFSIKIGLKKLKEKDYKNSFLFIFLGLLLLGPAILEILDIIKIAS